MSTPDEAESRVPSTSYDGSTVHVQDDGAGEVTVLLHSAGMSGDQWRRTAEPLVRGGARTIVPDLLGSGRSAPWPEGKPFRFSHDVEVVGRLLDRIGRPVHLVGHSYGGHIALRAASLAPARVRSLALYDPVAFGVLEPGRDAAAFEEMSSLTFRWGESAADHEAWLASFVDYWGGGAGSWSRLRDAARAEMVRVGWLVHEGARSLVADRTPESAYRSLSAPTVLMTGEGSPLSARTIVARLGAAIPGARVVRFAGAGHMGPLTHVKQFNEILVAHLAAARG
jgi:pimeloyl-ACP methyl ester carboxylesterase